MTSSATNLQGVMKRLSYIMMLAVAAAAAFSCTKEIEKLDEETVEVLVPMSFTATSAETKTVLDENGVSINWLATDEISVFDGVDNRQFSTEGSGRSVTFTGSAANADRYYAVYPYNSSASLSGTTVSTTLSASQTPTEGSFADGLNINASVSTDKESFVFDNVLSVVRFTIDASTLGGKTIKKVELTTPNAAAGDVSISFGETITATAGTETTNTVYMEDNNGLSDGDYYFVLLPQKAGAITFKVTSTDDCIATVEATVKNDFVAGSIKQLGTVKNLVWTKSYSIVFGYSTNSDSPISASTQASTVISDGTSYVTSRPFTVTTGNAYYGGSSKDFIRIGKSGSSANLQIALSDAGSVCVRKVIVNCKQFSASNAGTLSVNEATAQSVPSDAGNLEYSFNDVDITELSLAVSKATYVYSIEVTYRYKSDVMLSFPKDAYTITEGDSFTAPELTIDPDGLNVSYSSSNESVAEVNASTGAITLKGGIGSTTITATFAGNDEYKSGSASYTLTVNRALSTSISQMKEDLNGSTAEMSFTASLTDAVVTRKYSDNIAYIQDGTAGILVTDAADLTEGDSYNGTVSGKMITANNQPKITDFDVSAATKTTGASKTPEEVTIATLVSNMSSYDGKLCKIVKAKANATLATGNNKSIVIAQGENTMTLFTRASFSANTIVSGSYYDVVGVPCLYGSTNEIVVLSTNDVTESTLNWVLSSIAVKTAPTKTSYNVGEYFEPAGLVLSTVEMDSEVNTITRVGSDVSYDSESSDFTFYPDLSTTLTTTNSSVIITYNGKTATQEILVTDPSVATFETDPADGETIEWKSDEYGSEKAETITVSLNSDASGYSVSYTLSSDWTVSDTEDGTITVYPNSENTAEGDDDDRTLNITISHKDDPTLTATITLKQAHKGGGLAAGTVLYTETFGTTAVSIASYNGDGSSTYNNASTLSYSTTNTNAKIDATSSITNCSGAHLYINGKNNASGYTVTISGIKAYNAKKVRVTWGCNNTYTTVGIVESSSDDVKSASSAENTGDFELSGTEEAITLKIFNNAKQNTRSDNYTITFIE